MSHPRPRLFTYPCGLHRGPKPVPKVCPVCGRAKAEEAARPPVPGYGVGQMTALRKEKQRAMGRAVGQAHVGSKAIQFPQKRRYTSGPDLLRALNQFTKAKRKDKP